jgi:hypothetical protein
LLWKEILNNDGIQQHKQSSLILTELTEHKQTTMCLLYNKCNDYKIPITKTACFTKNQWLGLFWLFIYYIYEIFIDVCIFFCYSLLPCGKNLHDCIISLRGEVCVHKTSLTPPLFIEVFVSSQTSERSCICVY